MSTDFQAVAHDLRSSLRAIAIYVDLLTTESGLEQPDASRVEQLRVSIDRAIDEHTHLLDQLVADGS